MRIMENCSDVASVSLAIHSSQTCDLDIHFCCQGLCVRKKNFSDTIFCSISQSFQWFNNR